MPAVCEQEGFRRAGTRLRRDIKEELKVHRTEPTCRILRGSVSSSHARTYKKAAPVIGRFAGTGAAVGEKNLRIHSLLPPRD
jgi:hypothetical protein